MARNKSKIEKKKGKKEKKEKKEESQKKEERKENEETKEEKQEKQKKQKKSNTSEDAAAAPATPTRPKTPSPRIPLAGTPTSQKLAFPIISPRVRRAMDARDLMDLPQSQPQRDEAPNALIEKWAQQLANTFTKIKSDQRHLENLLEEVTTSISFLDEKWNAGRIDLTSNVYKEERDALLSKQCNLMTNLSVMRTAASQLAGHWNDELIIGSREWIDDWAYIDAAIRCYPEVPHAKKTVKSRRNPSAQNKFRNDLMRSYGIDRDEYDAWCPIAHITYSKKDFRSAHIVDVSIGERTAQALFGDEQEHIWNPRNGLFVLEAYEKLLDSAKAVILPATDDEGCNEFQFFLLTDDIGRRAAPVWGQELHGRTLIFKNAFRPSKKYLYFKFAMSMLRRRRAEVPGHLDNMQKLPDAAKKLWASPGPYLKRSVLYKFSRQLGCLTSDEADKFWGVEKSSEDELDDANQDMAETLATVATAGIFRREQHGRSEDEEEDEDEDEDADDDDEDRSCVYSCEEDDDYDESQ